MRSIKVNYFYFAGLAASFKDDFVNFDDDNVNTNRLHNLTEDHEKYLY